MPLAFTKMHGLGNDFVVVDRRAAGTPLSPDECVRLCDRHRGVGADGVLALLPSSRAPLAMHVTNADGSVAQMCGNGLRCVVRLAVRRGLLPTSGGAVETGRGVLECFIEPDGQVRVDLGVPIIPSMEILQKGYVLGGRVFHDVSMGNPHAVTFVEDADDLTSLARTLGPQVETHPRFRERTNVEFARVATDGVDLVVWERGAGLTLACGTGACATVVAAALTGRAKTGEAVTVRLPGGALRVRVEPDLSRVWLTGPAQEVFEGVA